MKRVPFAFENLGPADRPFQIDRELRALANLLNPDPDRRRPKVLGVCEAVGKVLPDTLTPYRLIRDRSTPSRANIALYLLARLHVEAIRWHDLRETWPRTEHPGIHEPRSILRVEVEGWRVLVGHAPPIAPESGKARDEWHDAMVDLMTSVGPVLALVDPNSVLILDRGRIVTAGTNIEAVVGRNIVLDGAFTPGSVNGVPMLTDHRRALLGRARRRT